MKAIQILIVTSVLTGNIWALSLSIPYSIITKPNNDSLKLSFDFYPLEKYQLKEKIIVGLQKDTFRFSSFYLSDEVQNYLEEILFILRENSINREQIDWNEFRHKFYCKMNGYTFVWQTYPKIQEVLSFLNDDHSFFVQSNDSDQICEGENFFIQEIKGKILPKKIAYILVPGTFCTTGEYAEQMQATIKQLDKKKPKKWIIDLRGNFGGNMWEMFLGLSPLLNEGVHGFFGVNNPNDFTAWVYECGHVKVINNEEEVDIESLDNFYSIKKKRLSIAVLIDNETASSGEALALVFKGKKNTRFFGSKTSGLTSGNATYNLSDGSSIYLTERYFFDRNKQKYTNGISPDEQISLSHPEDCLHRAINWLNNHSKLFLFKS